MISIPLPSFPMPEIDMGGVSIWEPEMHQLTRSNITAATPVEITVDVTDKGGGVKAAILSWTNDTQWENITMTGLPMKLLMGGPADPIGGMIYGSFPAYPPSPIPTTYQHGFANATIPGHPAGSNISYRVYIIDDYDYVTVVPSTAPTQTNGTNDTLDLDAQTYSYNVTSGTIANFTATWGEVKQMQTQQANGGGTEDLLASLEDAGIDIFGAIMEASSIFQMMTGNFSPEVLLDIILGMVEYFEVRGVNPFEVVDQLLGVSGSSNASIALDLLAEGQIGLLDLMMLFEVNMTIVVNQIADAITPPLEEGDTRGEAFFNLLNATRADSNKKASFYAFLEANDLYYEEYPFSTVYKHNMTDDSVTDLTGQAFTLAGDVNTTYYYGAPKISTLLGDEPIDGFEGINMEIVPGAYTNNGSKYQWEYYNDSWTLLDVAEDNTNNLTQSGRIIFAPSAPMQTTKPYGAAEALCWIRLRLQDTQAEAVPVSSVNASVDFILYYYDYLAVDLFGSSMESVVINETDSFSNLLTTMTESNGYAEKIWNLMEQQGVTLVAFLEEIGGHFVPLVGPVTCSEIVATTAPLLALVVYGILLLGVVVAARGRGGTYSIKPSRVKSWYNEMARQPSLKTIEEIKKLKS